MDLMKVFGLEENQNNRLTTIEILEDFMESCGDYGQILKGGMALHYYYNDNSPSSRSTVDLDFHIKQESIWKNFKLNACNNASKNSKFGIRYTIIKSKINPNGESLTIQSILNDKEICKFKVDMNYGSYCKINNNFKFSIYSVESILADKISIICSPKILRRTKDLYDVFLIISNEEFSMVNLATEIKKKLDSLNRTLEVLYILKPDFLAKLEYAYYKIKLLDFPDFRTVIDFNINFILPLIDSINGKNKGDTTWDNKRGIWKGKVAGSAVVNSIEGIICKESASGMLGLSTFPPYPLLIYNSSINLKLRVFRFIKTDIDRIKCNKLKDNIFITTKEQTICDLLIDGEFRILMESLETYIDDNANLDSLYNIAKDLNLTKNLDEALKELETYEHY